MRHGTISTIPPDAAVDNLSDDDLIDKRASSVDGQACGLFDLEELEQEGCAK
jgi:hypothetical protein